MNLALQEVDHRYRILRLLGEGLSGEVFLVESKEGRFALKLLKPFSDERMGDSIVSAFKFEFGFLKDLRHPHVVRIHDFGFDEALQRFYFTEEYLEGLPLDEVARGAPPDLIGRLFIQAIEGLQAIHRAHILHGDLKPSNLLVVEEVVKIIDLGLSDPRFPFTAGTPSTMAPEKILQDPVDERSDLYSLGVIFYSLFTGENPFARESIQSTYEAHLTFRPPKLTLKNPKVPSFWNEIFETLLAKNPAYRYRNCTELLEAIDLAQPEITQRKKKPSLWRPERWVARTEIVEELKSKIVEASEHLRIETGRGGGGETVKRRNGETVKRRNGETGKKKGVPKVFMVAGETGVGKSRMVQEMKYLLQMEKIKVFESKLETETLFPPSPESWGLWILDDWSRFKKFHPQLLEKFSASCGGPLVLLTLLPEEAKVLGSQLEKNGIEFVSFEIPPFSRHDLDEFLKKILGLEEIPKNFLQNLWEKTHGNPQLVLGLLDYWVKQNKLVDAHGHWNLAIFKEGAVDFPAFPLELSQIDQALANLPAADHEKKAQCWIQRGEALLKKNLFDEAAAALQKAEAESNSIENLPQKLHLHAKIYERKVYQALRLHHLEEGRRHLERAMTLLEESGVFDEVLSIRLQNFFAWLLCQEGKLDQAIEIFSKQQVRWEKLLPSAQARVLNNELGFAYLQRGEAQKAVTALEKSLRFYDQVGDALSQMKDRYNLAEAYLLAKDYPTAIQNYLQAAELARIERNFELLLRIYNGLGKTHHLKGSLSEATSYYERALDLARYLEDFSSASAIAQNIGSIESENNQWDKAQAHFELSLKLLNQIPELNAHAKYLKCRALLEIGDLFRKQKMFEEALGFVREARHLAFQEKSLEAFRFWVVVTQCQIEKDQGRTDKLQDLLAELLPLADDEEKRGSCKEFDQFFSVSPSLRLSVSSLPSRGETEKRGDGETEKRGKDFEEKGATRVERIRSGASGSPELQALIRVARWLASEKDPEKLLYLIIRQAAELSGAEAGLILLTDARGNIQPKASVNLTMDDPLIQMSRNIAQQVLARGEKIQVEDALADPQFNTYRSVIDLHLRSILALPIQSQNRALGVLALVHRFRDRAFQDSSLELMEAFADQAGIALENARLVAELEASRLNLIKDLETAQEELSQAHRNLTESSVLVRFADLQLLSQNKVMRELFQMVERIRDTEISVVLYGESGTGKELIARSLHKNSKRAKGPFIAVNCAALPSNLIESELFGFKAGAFTGAVRDKKGLVEEANGGTLFLDEIADLELSLQAKLLRVIQEKELTRVGETRPISVDFRLVSASHQDLQEAMKQGRFREDLYYRICEIQLTLPPLRERLEDIPLLAQHFINRFLKEQGEKGKVQLGKDLMKVLMEYAWPGNVRELENVIRVAAALRHGNVLHFKDLPENLQRQLQKGLQFTVYSSQISQKQTVSSLFTPNSELRTPNSKDNPFDPKKTWREIEALIIAKALLHFSFDVVAAAKSLQCAPSKVYQRIREYSLEKRAQDFQRHPFVYPAGTPLVEIKQRVFQTAQTYCKGSPYQVAELLKVSPGMVYQWIGAKA